MKKVVLNKCLRHFDHLHASGQSAVVPPVGLQRRHTVQSAGVVDFHDNAVLALDKLVCDFEIKWRESANVLAEFCSVQPNARKIICRAKIQEHTPVQLSLIRKIALVPNRALVKQQ